MSLLHRDFLQSFGWSLFFEQQLEWEELSTLVPARVVGEEKNRYRVQWESNQSALATVPGRLRFQADGREDFPTVGDWVLCQMNSGTWTIVRVLARKSLLSRKTPGRTTDSQLIAANVDQVFIASALNQDFNMNRLERYLILVGESGATPVILLTKSDLCQDVESVLKVLQEKFPAVETMVTSLTSQQGLSALTERLSLGSTSVIVGSSGVGKSSLLNYLLGGEILKTQTIRQDDGKGRHTTTSRYLFALPQGGVVIDTPGVRELGLNVTDLEHHSSAARIEELFVKCKFSNCTHQREPGCAVQQALQAGALAPEQWENYLKLLREISFHARKGNKAAQSGAKKKWKQISVALRQQEKLRRK